MNDIQIKSGLPLHNIYDVSSIASVQTGVHFKGGRSYIHQLLLYDNIPV